VTDRPDPDASADDSPEIAEVRRLLAEARHTEPMPADVATRMDQVLARLGDETPAPRLEPSGTAPVVSIAAHRRRRAAGLLVAAAAVVVGGVTLAQNVHLSSGGSARSTAEDAPGAVSADAGREPGNTGNDVASQPPSEPGPSVRIDDGRIVVPPHRFSLAARQGQSLLASTYDDATKAVNSCTDLSRHARAIPAEYRRAPAALVYRRPIGSSQVVALILCGTDRPIRTTTLPSP
jgi:hypothetical protein